MEPMFKSGLRRHDLTGEYSVSHLLCGKNRDCQQDSKNLEAVFLPFRQEMV